jgi:hypothetical protein
MDISNSRFKNSYVVLRLEILRDLDDGLHVHRAIRLLELEVVSAAQGIVRYSATMGWKGRSAQLNALYLEFDVAAHEDVCFGPFFSHMVRKIMTAKRNGSFCFCRKMHFLAEAPNSTSLTACSNLALQETHRTEMNTSAPCIGCHEALV